MKNLYVCEKCGMTYENWQDADKCEMSHQFPSIYDVNESVEGFAHYAKGEKYPTVLNIPFAKWDSKTDTTTTTYARYELKGMTKKDDIEVIIMGIAWNEAISENYYFNRKKENAQ